LWNGAIIYLLVRLLNAGSKRANNNIDIETAKEVYKSASLKNCLIKADLWAPASLRTPISFALLMERAVVKS